MRLIDADALKEAVNGFYDNRFNGLVPSELIEYAQTVDNLIDNASTVEQPTGKWEICEDDQNFYFCSNCKEVEMWDKYRYCPYCGAKMH